jgi:hypothetical protein
MKIPVHQPELKGSTFAERRAAFLAELSRYSSRLDLETVWMILQAVRKASPQAFAAFTKSTGNSEQNFRKQYARDNKPRLDAEWYAGFLHCVYCWQLQREGRNAMETVHKERGLAFHRKWKALEFPRERWLGAQKKLRQRMGMGELRRNEFERLEAEYDKDTAKGRALRRDVRRILTERALPMTPFRAEELAELLEQVDHDAHPGVTISLD